MNRSSGTQPGHSARRHEFDATAKRSVAAATDSASVAQAQRPPALNNSSSDGFELPHPLKRAASDSDSGAVDRSVVAAAAAVDQNGPAELRSATSSKEAAQGHSFDDKRLLPSVTSIGKTVNPQQQENPKSPRVPQEKISPSSVTPPATTRATKSSTISSVSKAGVKGVTGGIRSVTSDGQTWVQKFHISVPASAMTDSDQDDQRYSSQHDDAPSKPKATAHVERDVDPVGYERGTALKEALQQGNRPERSVSRGRSHMDKSIEATVKKPESSGYVRSRKASHMMGIFDSQNEEKRSTLRAQDLELSHSDSSSVKSRPLSPVSPSSSIFKDAPRHDSPTTDYFGKHRVALEKLDTEAIYQSEEPDEISPGASATSPGLETLSTRHDVSAHPHLPAKLLEEIRQTTLKRPTALRKKASTPGVATINEIKDLEESPKSRPQSEDHEEEHIAAAVYYPHEGPSPEEIDSFEVHDSSPKLRRDSQSLKLRLRDKATDVNDDVLSHAEHIDISVESEFEKSLLHGTLKQAEAGEDEEDVSLTPRMPAADQKPDRKPPISSSESDIESSDEFPDLSQANDGVETPTARSPKQRRMRTGTVAKPKNAVTLAPYRHQVGGHSTIFRFSRRAVCKQLNNRENEFYERIEKTHPDMLKFLPRYIGVLNVTFSKGPKPEAADGKTSRSEGGSNQDVSQTRSNRNSLDSGSRSESARMEPHELAQPRIVSHSQQLAPFPQVLLNQNRHILPSEYFGLPERPKSADPTHFRQRKSQDLGHGGSLLSSELSRHKDESPPVRPAPPEHSPSWGTTSVNLPLKDKVLREVFGPPPIKHKRRHGHNHNTMPLRKDAENRRRGNMSMGVFEHAAESRLREPPRRSHSMHQSDHFSTESNGSEHDGSEPAMSKEYSSSTSRFDDLRNDLEKVKTTGSADTDVSDESNRHTIRRRHSGMGLRRRRRSVSGNEQVNLEYFEDEALSAMKEAEVFAMDEDDKPRTVSEDDRVPLTAETLSATIEQDPDTDRTKLIVGSDAGGDMQEVIAADELPVNPKDAQSNSSDQRVAYFILLEDLTAGMGRPCVLDLKMGTRQHGVEASEKKIKSQRDKCRSTTSQQLGVRICGMQTFNRKTKESKYEDKYFGRSVKAGREFREALIRFLYDGESAQSVDRHIPTIIHKISKLESTVRRLPGYRFYASSLLMFYDAEPENSREYLEALKSGVDLVKQRRDEGKEWPPPIELKLVDFANCVTAEDPVLKTARTPPAHPHDIDRGYLRGLKSLKLSFERIRKDIQSGRYFECHEGEQAGRLREKWSNELAEDSKTDILTERDEGDVSI